MAACAEYFEATSSQECIAYSNDHRVIICTDSFARCLTMNCGVDKNLDKVGFLQSSFPINKTILDIPSFPDSYVKLLIKDLSREEFKFLSSDRILNPMKYSFDSVPHTGYAKAEWSPVISKGPYGRCILATLSFDHRLCLHWQKDTQFEWFKICDLTEKRLEHERHKVTTLKDYYWYKDWCFSQASMCLKWFPDVFTDDDSKIKYMILATGMKTGHIVLWKITISKAFEFDCVVLCTVSTRQAQTVSLEWCHKLGMLVIGYTDGQIHGLHFDVKDFNKEPQCTCLYGESTFLKPASFCFLDSEKDDTNILVAGIEHCVLVLQLTKDGKNVISKSHQFLDNELPFVGMVAVTQNTILMTSHEAIVQKIDISVGEEGIEIKNVKLDLMIDYDERCVVCQGFSLSPNKVFATFLIRPWPSFDRIDPKHKIVTSRLFVLCIDDIIKGSNCGNTCKEVLTNTQESLGQMMDVLELYRLNITNDKTNSTVIKEESIKTNTRRCNQLQRIQAIVQCTKLKCHPKTDDFKEEIERLESMIPVLTIYISVDWICETWKHLDSLKLLYSSMTGTDKSIVSAMMLYLEAITTVLSDNDQVKKTVLSMSEYIGNDVYSFKCCICNESLQILTPHWKCNNGHVFSICSKTYLPVQGTEYLTCKVCHMVAINLDDIACSWLTGDHSRCIYCESMMYT